MAIIIVLILLLVFFVFNQKRITRRGGREQSKTYILSGYDGSYIWRLAEILQENGWTPARHSAVSDGYLIRGLPEVPSCTYLHSLVDLTWLGIPIQATEVKHERSNYLKNNYLAHKLKLYQMLGERPWLPKTVNLTDLNYTGGKYIVFGAAASRYTIGITTWLGRDTWLIENEKDYRSIREKYLWQAQIMYDVGISNGMTTKYYMLASEFIESAKIAGKPFVVTFYAVVMKGSVEIYERGLICHNEKSRDIVICDATAKVSVFPEEYPFDANKVRRSLDEIISSLTQLTENLAEGGYSPMNIDCLIDKDEKLWLLECNTRFVFYNMPPVGYYRDFHHGYADFIYQCGISRLFP